MLGCEVRLDRKALVEKSGPMIVMDDRGQGVPQVDAAALSLYRKAADQGNATALYLLGLLYTIG
jgi:hypothetical protein